MGVSQAVVPSGPSMLSFSKAALSANGKNSMKMQHAELCPQPTTPCCPQAAQLYLVDPTTRSRLAVHIVGKSERVDLVAGSATNDTSVADAISPASALGNATLEEPEFF